jgi:hypothetical protein
MPLKDGIDLLLDIIQVARPLLGLTGVYVPVILACIVGLGLEVIHLTSLGITITDQATGNFVEQVLEETLRGAVALRLRDDTFQALEFGLLGLVGKLTKHRMEEIHATKGASHDGIDAVPSPRQFKYGVASNVRENISFTHLDESEFGIVRMSSVILEAVQTSAQQAKCLVQIIIVARSGIATAKLDRTAEDSADQGGGGVDVHIFGSDVGFETGPRVD